MEADAGLELAANYPLLFDERAQRRVVRVGRVLLKAERRRHEIDAHAERLAQRQHRRGGFRCRQSRQLVDGELAQILASGVGREGFLSRGAVLVVAAFHLLEGGPHVREKLRKFGLVQSEAD